MDRRTVHEVCAVLLCVLCFTGSVLLHGAVRAVSTVVRVSLESLLSSVLHRLDVVAFSRRVWCVRIVPGYCFSSLW